MRAAVGLAAAAVLLFGETAWAMHDVEHRFTVWGRVADDAGQPLSGAKVTIRDARLPDPATTLTRRDGSYEAILHLHNDNLGDEVVVTAGERSKTIRATFNPQDMKTERKAQVDFGQTGTGAGVETAGAGGRWWTWAVVALLTAGAVAWGVSRRKARRLAAVEAQKMARKGTKGMGGRA